MIYIRQALYLSLFFLPVASFAQATIKVKVGDTTKMVFKKGEWFFKENLPDGYYYSHYGDDTIFIAKDILITKGVKEGLESRYYMNSHQKYAEINWKNGKKDGLEIHYNTNGTVSYLLTFKNDELDGPCVLNSLSGAKEYTGFYKNGFRDSLWLFYDHDGDRMDSANYWKSALYDYTGAEKYLISAWNRNGVQTVKDGKGIVIDSGSYITSTFFFNGQKSGKQEIRTEVGFIESTRYYEEGLLIKEINYSDSNQIASAYEWTYPFQPIVDTSKVWINPWITDIFYNKIETKYTPINNGFWTEYYSNGSKIYEGEYNKGVRMGKWFWYYKNGNTKIFADFSNNKWQHYDIDGKLISNLNEEYLTILNDGFWFINGSLDSTPVVLSRKNEHTVTPRLVFHYNGMLEANSYLECGKDIYESSHSYELNADRLKLVLKNPINGELKAYLFRVEPTNSEKINLHRLKE